MQLGDLAGLLYHIIPIVPRPPTLKCPNRLKGAEQVVTLGLTLRITITEDGSDGMSLDVMVASSLLNCKNEMM